MATQLLRAIAIALTVVVPARAAPQARDPASKGTAPEDRPPDCSQDGWCWENPRPNGNGSLALWGSAADDVWAAGDGGTILHFDGAVWSRVKTPVNVTLEAIWGRHRDDVWVAGARGTVLHWDGKTWSNRDVAKAGRLVAISAGDTGNVWVADVAGSAWGWTGDGWERRVTAICDVGSARSGVVMAATCVWDTLHTGSGGTLVHPPPWRGHWDGVSLVRGQKPPPPTGRNYGGSRNSSVLLRTWGVSSEVSRWDGFRWQPLGSGIGASWTPSHIYPSTRIRAIWGASDDDIWAVGASGQILRWNGKRWRSFDGGTRGDLDHVWGSGPNDVWATGTAGMLHWDGARWKTVTTSAGDAQLEDVWGLDACHMWAAGADGTVLRRDCNGWSAIASGVTADLWGVGGSGADDVWVVGDAGTILRFDDKGRSTRASTPTNKPLFGLWAASTSQAWAVGGEGTILQWDGSDWKQIQSPVRDTFRSIHGANAKRIVVAGDRGRFVTFDGARWSAMDPPPGCAGYRGDRGAATRAWVGAANEIWVSCPTSRVFRWDGAKWNASAGSAGHAYAYYDIAASAGGVWVVGAKGTVIQNAGDRWMVRSSSTSLNLRAIWTTAAGESWVVGDHGTILSYRAGGRMEND